MEIDLRFRYTRLSPAFSTWWLHYNADVSTNLESVDEARHTMPSTSVNIRI